MIYEPPDLTGLDTEVIDQISRLQSMLAPHARLRSRWYGTLRRAQFARAVQGSNSIEGYNASVEEAAAVIDEDAPPELSEDTRLAIAGYRDAMTFALQFAAGVSPRDRTGSAAASEPPMLDLSTLRSLHFMMIRHDLAHHPGQFRPGSIWVENQDGESVYQAPARPSIDSLLAEMFDQSAALLRDEAVPAVVAAAMAHLNLVLIHPFSDGNGRMARCIQTLLLAASAGAVGDPLAPEFLSIEEYLGQNTLRYYTALTDVAAGRWSPQRSVRPWMEFCLTAHLRQTNTVLRRLDETVRLWGRCSELAEQRGLPPRVVDALCDCARGWSLRRSLYMARTETSAGDPISDGMASRDLQSMVRAGLLAPIGDKRGRSYRRSTELADVWDQVRAASPVPDNPDPYAKRDGADGLLPPVSVGRPVTAEDVRSLEDESTRKSWC